MAKLRAGTKIVESINATGGIDRRVVTTNFIDQDAILRLILNPVDVPSPRDIVDTSEIPNVNISEEGQGISVGPLIPIRTVAIRPR